LYGMIGPPALSHTVTRVPAYLYRRRERRGKERERERDAAFNVLFLIFFSPAQKRTLIESGGGGGREREEEQRNRAEASRKMISHSPLACDINYY
jgi:hypothetical protein